MGLDLWGIGKTLLVQVNRVADDFVGAFFALELIDFHHFVF
jgi:hypothetical protein